MNSTGRSASSTCRGTYRLNGAPSGWCSSLPSVPISTWAPWSPSPARPVPARRRCATSSSGGSAATAARSVRPTTDAQSWACLAVAPSTSGAAPLARHPREPRPTVLVVRVAISPRTSWPSSGHLASTSTRSSTADHRRSPSANSSGPQLCGLLGSSAAGGARRAHRPPGRGTSGPVIEALLAAKTNGTCVLVATHDPDLIAAADEVLPLHASGLLRSSHTRGAASNSTADPVPRSSPIRLRGRGALTGSRRTRSESLGASGDVHPGDDRRVVADGRGCLDEPSPSRLTLLVRQLPVGSMHPPCTCRDSDASTSSTLSASLEVLRLQRQRRRRDPNPVMVEPVPLPHWMQDPGRRIPRGIDRRHGRPDDLVGHLDECRSNGCECVGHERLSLSMEMNFQISLKFVTERADRRS